MNRSDPTPIVAFQGAAGAYSERAIGPLFPAGAHTRPERTAREAAAAVESGDADYALLPVENTLAGSVPDTLAVLADTGLRVVAETVLPIHHALIGVAGADARAVRRVLSHPIALAQCTRFFASRPDVAAEAAYDTAGAARDVAQAGDAAVAAIAGEWLAQSAGLAVLARNIEDRPDNQTRFLLLAAPRADGRTAALPAPVLAAGGNAARTKTMLAVEVDNRPGALVALLATFAVQGLDLSWIESRPTGRPWSYRFFLDLVGGSDDLRTAAALDEARRHARVLRVLGSFRAAARTDE